MKGRKREILRLLGDFNSLLMRGEEFFVYFGAGRVCEVCVVNVFSQSGASVLSLSQQCLLHSRAENKWSPTDQLFHSQLVLLALDLKLTMEHEIT